MNHIPSIWKPVVITVRLDGTITIGGHTVGRAVKLRGAGFAIRMNDGFECTVLWRREIWGVVYHWHKTTPINKPARGEDD